MQPRILARNSRTESSATLLSPYEEKVAIRQTGLEPSTSVYQPGDRQSIEKKGHEKGSYLYTTSLLFFIIGVLVNGVGW